MPASFLILGTQRTGTQALFNALNNHPDIFCGGEWTQYVAPHHKIGAITRAFAGQFDNLIARRPRDRQRIHDRPFESVKQFGFKILFRSSDKWIVHPRFAPALMLDRIEAHLQWLTQRQDVQVIQVIRRDSIEWLKSKYLSKATGRFTVARYPEDAKVTIPVARAIRALQAKSWVDQRLQTLRERGRYHLVVYEDFLANNRLIIEQCYEFLGCDRARSALDSSFLKPQSTRTAAQYIMNFKELEVELEERDLRLASLSDDDWVEIGRP